MIICQLLRKEDCPSHYQYVHSYVYLKEKEPELSINKEKATCPVCNEDFERNAIEDHAALCISLIEDEEELVKGLCNEANEERLCQCASADNHAEECHMMRCVNETVMEMSEVTNPEYIIDKYISKFMRGRPLDITDEYGVVEGKTVDIFVSRDRILEDAFSELKEAGDMSFPIEVTFTGEKALDLRGPRKEFLTACVHNLNDQFIKDGILITEKDIGKDLFIKYEKENAFRTAGLLLGLSLLQGGSLPTLFKNPDVFLSPSNKGEELFSEGLDKIGLLQLCSKKKEILRLFDVNSPKVNILTYSSLIKLFEVIFSEEGSNGRQFEMAVYRLFLDYVKEVAAFRRGNITLQSLLQFVTGSPKVPILGYKLPPKICFVDTESIIPTSSTCSVKLFLPKKNRK